MRVGASFFATDRSMRPDDLAPVLEERGFESLFLTEHTHVPVQHDPYYRQEPFDEKYRRLLDPWVALTAAAAVTERLRLSTGVCLVAQHDPLTLAKQVASLDLLSGGRVILGAGYGWNAPEVEHHGVPFAERRAILREKVLALRALWTQDEAEFHGAYVEFAPSWSFPKPVQSRIPVLLGARAGPRTFAHIVEFGDGWLPIGGRGLGEDIPRLRRLAQDAGRDPDAIDITVFGTWPQEGQLEHFARAGVDRVAVGLPHGTRAEVMAALDRVVPLARPFLS